MPYKAGIHQYNHIQELLAQFQTDIQDLVSANVQLTAKHNAESYKEFLSTSETVRDRWKEVKQEMSYLNQKRHLGGTPAKNVGERNRTDYSTVGRPKKKKNKWDRTKK